VPGAARPADPAAFLPPLADDILPEEKKAIESLVASSVLSLEQQPVDGIAQADK
jgi:hypothetical protein